MQVFVDRFIQQSSGKNYQVFMIGENFEFPPSVSGRPGFSVVNQEVKSHNALFILATFLDGKLPW